MATYLAALLIAISATTQAQDFEVCDVRLNSPPCEAVRIEIYPERPRPLEPVYMRVYGFVPDSVPVDGLIPFLPPQELSHPDEPVLIQVSLSEPALSQARNSVPIDPDQYFDVLLGTLPWGTYQAELVYRACTVFGCRWLTRRSNEFRTGLSADEFFRFQQGLIEHLMGGEPPYSVQYHYRRAIVDYSGMWWNPDQSGWGLSIHHVLQRNTLVAVWNQYGPEGQPIWFSFGPGQWTSTTRYEAPILRTRGTPLGQPYDAEALSHFIVGEGILDFSDPGRGTLDFTVDGERHLHPIERLLPGPPDLPTPAE